MEYLKRGLHSTFGSIKKHKWLFLAIVLLQIIFAVSSLYLGAQYLVKILEDTQGIIGPLENANYDSQKIEEGAPFTPDYTAIYNSYQSMLKNIASFAGWMIIIFSVLNGGIWLLSHWMFQDKENWKHRMKEGSRFFLKAWISAFLLLGPFIAVSYYVLLHFIRLSESFSEIAVVLKTLLIALIVVYYFFLAALAAAPLVSWKKFIAAWIRISFTCISKTAVLFLIVAAVLLSSFTAVYGAIEYGKSAALLLSSGLLSILTITVSRIFWIAGIREINAEDDKNKLEH